MTAAVPESETAGVSGAVGLTEKKGGRLEKRLGAFYRFLEVDAPEQENFSNVKEERARFRAHVASITRRSYIIIGLVFLNIVLQPFLRPTYHYMGLSPEKKTLPLVGLFEANQTDQAILSWSATGITEIMTLGFGDFDARLLSQRSRFTKDGWQSFVEALVRQNLREGFKMRQLVLTTVPTDSPVITAKGMHQGKDENEAPVYRWIVELPIIMTYLTNNNVSSARKGIVRLTIVRVPSHENIAGIGIKTWQII